MLCAIVYNTSLYLPYSYKCRSPTQASCAVQHHSIRVIQNVTFGLKPQLAVKHLERARWHQSQTSRASFATRFTTHVAIFGGMQCLAERNKHCSSTLPVYPKRRDESLPAGYGSCSQSPPSVKSAPKLPTSILRFNNFCNFMPNLTLARVYFNKRTCFILNISLCEIIE